MTRSRPFLIALSTACATTSSTPTAEKAPMASDYANIVSAPDRTDADRALDEGRRPAETLAFLSVKPGMRVGELGAGGGYTTELVVRAIGKDGVVFAENPPAFLAAFLKKPWEERVARLAAPPFVRCDRAFEEPFPPEAKDLDLVFINAIYHDAVNAKVDRAKMNGAVFAALKRGGHYVVIDSSAKPGTGLGATESLHRIDEAAVKAEVEAAGFKLETSGDFLRHPDDARDWNSSPRAAGEKRGHGDRFALKFVKP
jgi:predicted methyltransferase